MSEVLYLEKLTHYFIKKFGLPLLMFVLEIVIFYMFYHLELDPSEILFIIFFPAIFCILIHVIILVRFFTMRERRLKITSNSIIEGNWNFTKKRELSFPNISYIGINEKYLYIIIFDKYVRRSMVFLWPSLDEYRKVISILKKLPLELKTLQENLRRVRVDKSLLNNNHC